MYRFGLAPKFTAIVLAAVLSTGILVSAAMFFEGQNRLRDQIIDNNEASEAFAPVTEAAWDSVMLMAVVLLVAALGAGLLARHVTRPLADLQEAANSFDNEGRKQGIKQFIDDKAYKPGLGAYDKTQHKT